MRYTVGIYLDNGNPVELGGATLGEAISLAMRLTHQRDRHPWWEVCDEHSGFVVETNESYDERKRKK